MTQIFRITHYKNLPFILDNGLHCPNANVRDDAFVSIGYPTLIASRNDKEVPIAPGGNLSEYVPFYFTVKSPMLYVIAQANDPEVIRTPQNEIIYLVSSLEKLKEHSCKFVFTDRHAKLAYAKFYNQVQDVNKLNWNIIKSAEWGRQYGNERREIKQAECLVHTYVPLEALLGIACKDAEMAEKISIEIFKKQLNLSVKIKPEYYF
jgi:hypothetical protein